MTAANIAINRFGYGARPDDSAPADPKRWLIGQFDRYEPRPTALTKVPTRAAVAGELADFYAIRRDLYRQNGPRRRQQPAAATPATPDPTMAGTRTAAAMPADADNDPIRQARRFVGSQARTAYADAVGARATITLTSPAPFVERLVHFWANHFAISIDKLTVIGLGGLLEFEAIRPHVLGKFADLLLAVERHPAMLLYLDQAVSVGPNSPIGARTAQRPNAQRRLGLNENLAREIMELHTLGVRTGYSQADVTELARAMTGWTVAGVTQGPAQRLIGPGGTPGDFAFAERLHEPGARAILGKSYPAVGEAQAVAVLRDLAVHPATARHIATKLARHFAGDTPPPALVAKLERAFLQSGGDLPTVYRALIDAPEAWATAPVKFKTPWDWSLSTMRALGYRDAPPLPTVGLLNQLGQPVWKPGQPVGWDDIAPSWAGPDAVMRRVEAAERFASRAPAIDARALAPKLWPGALSPATAQQLARAESPGQALALMLVVPEAMRR